MKDKHLNNPPHKNGAIELIPRFLYAVDSVRQTTKVTPFRRDTFRKAGKPRENHLNMENNKKLHIREFILIACYVLSAANAHETSTTLSGCLKGSGCSQCPDSQYTLDKNGKMLCCPGCASALLYHGETPNEWCVCYVDTTSNSAESKTLKFPGGSTSRLPPGISNSGSPSNFFFGIDHPPVQTATTGGNLRDAVYILNHGTDRVDGGLDVSQAVHEALTLMANTIEELNARLVRLENILLHSGNQGQVIDRVGSNAGSPTTGSESAAPIPTSEGSCPGENFARVGGVCYHVSVWKDDRAVWEKANKACQDMGAKLAEPIDNSAFIALTQYLSLESSTTGNSYWIGGLYPGISWRWVYTGTSVTLRASYWTGEDASGNHVTPGDTDFGRCLSFSYLFSASSYFFAAAECGYEKYYICEQLK